ncbi:hypothetical protein ABES25_18325 [Bacillus gobiensis]|uniref:hypothetical protein n=1 Tax=Bacillus gobiensis TaxID=1441095 RepID=UPI003D1B31C6
MKDHDFLPKHYGKAAKHQKCLHDLLLRMEHQLFEGDIEELDLCRKNMANSIREIKRLQEIKKNNDALKSTLYVLKARGIDVEVVLRRGID